MKVIDKYHQNPQLLADFIYSIVEQCLKQFYPSYIEFPQANIQALKYRILRHLTEQIQNEEK